MQDGTIDVDVAGRPGEGAAVLPDLQVTSPVRSANRDLGQAY